jgi:hypothetical protein
MKNSSLPIIALLAAIAAIALLPVGPIAASIALTTAGLFAILASDYGRNLEPLQVRAAVVPFEFAGRNAAGMNRAA